MLLPLFVFGEANILLATIQVKKLGSCRHAPRAPSHPAGSSGPLGAGALLQGWVLPLPPTDADLQIGKLMWGDSGLYYCIITTPDDLEGKNEDSVELLVLGEWRLPARVRSRPARGGLFSPLVPVHTRVPAGCTDSPSLSSGAGAVFLPPCFSEAWASFSISGMVFLLL